MLKTFSDVFEFIRKIAKQSSNRFEFESKVLSNEEITSQLPAEKISKIIEHFIATEDLQ